MRFKQLFDRFFEIIPPLSVISEPVKTRTARAEEDGVATFALVDYLLYCLAPGGEDNFFCVMDLIGESFCALAAKVALGHGSIDKGPDCRVIIVFVPSAGHKSQRGVNILK